MQSAAEKALQREDEGPTFQLPRLPLQQVGFDGDDEDLERGPQPQSRGSLRSPPRPGAGGLYAPAPPPPAYASLMGSGGQGARPSPRPSPRGSPRTPTTANFFTLPPPPVLPMNPSPRSSAASSAEGTPRPHSGAGGNGLSSGFSSPPPPSLGNLSTLLNSVNRARGRVSGAGTADLDSDRESVFSASSKNPRTPPNTSELPELPQSFGRIAPREIPEQPIPVISPRANVSLSFPKNSQRQRSLVPAPRLPLPPPPRLQSLKKIEDRMEKRWTKGRKLFWLIWIIVAILVVIALVAFVVIYFVLRIGRDLSLAGELSTGGDVRIGGDLNVNNGGLCTNSNNNGTTTSKYVGMGTCDPDRSLQVEGGLRVVSGLPTAANIHNVGVSFGDSFSAIQGIYVDSTSSDAVASSATADTFEYQGFNSSVVSGVASTGTSRVSSTPSLSSPQLRGTAATAPVVDPPPSSSRVSGSGGFRALDATTRSLFFIMADTKRMEVPGNSANPVVSFGNFKVQGQDLLLGTTARVFARNSDSSFQINPLESLSTVVVGSSRLTVSSSGTVTVGSSSTEGRISTFGSNRVSRGLPTLGDASNVGYSFDQDADTGFFATGGTSNAGNSLYLVNEGVSRVIVPPSSTSPVQLLEDVTISGALRITSTSTSRLVIGSTTSTLATAVIGGGIRTKFGIPTSDSSNFGYSFDNDGNTGMFASPDDSTGPATDLRFMANGQTRIMLPSDLSSSIAFSGSGSFSGTTLAMGSTPLGRRALEVVGSALHLNANNDFTSGVVINGNGVTIQGSRMAVGTSTLEGTLRSSGSVRAASGLPTGVGPFDIGFAFDAQSQTGMFSSGLPAPDLQFFVNANRRLTIPFTLADPMVLTGPLNFAATSINFGAAADRLMLSHGTGTDTLRINHNRDFAGGVLLNQDTYVKHLTTKTPPGPFLGIGRDGLNANPGSVEVNGGVRAREGTPGPPLSPSFDSGYSFLDRSSTGMYFDPSGLGRLQFFIGGDLWLSLIDNLAQREVRVERDLNVIGDRIMFDSKVVLEQDGTVLKINPSQDFTAVELGVPVSNAQNLAGAGIPVGVNPSPSGFTFTGHTTSGMYFDLTDVSAPKLALYHQALPFLTIFDSALERTQIHSNLHVSSSSIALGPTTNLIALQRNVNTLVINPGGEYTSGVRVDSPLSITGVATGTAGFHGSVGLPTLNDASTVGFGFASDGDSGMFRSGLDLHFMVNQVTSIKISPSGVISLPVSGSRLALGADSQTALLHQAAGNILFVNHDNTFPGGVTFGANQVRISRQATFDQLLVGEQNMTPGQARVFGSFRALGGLPGSETANVGFAFDNRGDTGMFLEGITDVSVNVIVDGALRILAPGNLNTEPVQIYGNLEYGFSTPKLALSTETATNTHMILNGNIGTTSGFNGGLRLNGQDVFVRREADDGTGRVRVGINRAFSTGGGTMEIGGGIRVARGQNTNADDDFGYSFVTQSRTGMFRHASDEHLYFKVNNVDRVAILDPTNRVDVFSNLRVTASEFDLFSLLAFRHVASANGPVLEINPTNSFSGGVRFGSGLVARVGNPTTTGGNGYAFEGNVETGLFLHVSGDPLRVYKDNVIKMSIPSAGAISVTTNFNIEGTTLRLGPSNLGALQADTNVLTVNPGGVYTDRVRVDSVLEATGRFVAPVGLPGNSGYAFSGFSTSGLFFESTLNPRRMQVLIDDVPYLTVLRSGEVRFPTDTSKLTMGSAASPPTALERAGTTLLVNPTHEFTTVQFGGVDDVRITRSGTNVQTSIGSPTSQGILSVTGSVRATSGALSGAPVGFGYTFADDLTTGMARVSSQLVFSSAGNERIRVPSATPIELVGGLAIGPVTPVLAIQGAAANDRLQLNPTVAFTNGVDINNGDMFIRRSGSAARVGIGFAGDTLAGSRGMLEVKGGIRSLRGFPADNTEDFGFTFVERPQTGLFLSGVDDIISLRISGNQRLTLDNTRVTSHLSLAVLGDTIRLGADSWAAMSRVGNNLVLNPGGEFNSIIFPGGLAGTTGAPTLTGVSGFNFAGFPTTGLFYTTGDSELSLYVNNVKRLSMTESGAVVSAASLNVVNSGNVQLGGIRALEVSGTSLHVNPAAGFTSGVSVRSALEATAGFRAPLGLGSDRGYAFSGFLETGVFFNDATSVLHYRIGGVSHAEVRATGNVALPGAAAGVLLGSLTAIQKSTNTLLINPTNSFVDGVLIGNSNVLIRGNQMAIGSTDFAGAALRVVGSIRASSGDPAATTGFSFDDQSGTGMYRVTNGGGIGLFANSNLRILSPATDPIVMVGTVSLGNSLASAGRAFSVSGDDTVLRIDNNNDFTSGLSFMGGSVRIRRDSDNKLQFGIGFTSLPADSTRGMLEVNGGIRARKGISGTDVGYSFLTDDSNSGMFLEEVSPRRLHFRVEGFTELSLVAGGMATLRGNLAVGGTEISLNGDVSVRDNGGILEINPDSDFASTRVTGVLSVGSLRAAQGVTEGFGFTGAVTTGMFLDSGLLKLMNGGVALDISASQISTSRELLSTSFSTFSSVRASTGFADDPSDVMGHVFAGSDANRLSGMFLSGGNLLFGRNGVEVLRLSDTTLSTSLVDLHLGGFLSLRVSGTSLQIAGGASFSLVEVAKPVQVSQIRAATNTGTIGTDGFAFTSFTATGMFADSSAANVQLFLAVAGTRRLSIPGDVAQDVTISGRTLITGVVRLGSTPRLAFDGSAATLEINPLNEFSEGVRVTGSLASAGRVVANAGLPASNAGFSFTDNLDTGLFLAVGPSRVLHLAVGGSSMVEVSSSTGVTFRPDNVILRFGSSGLETLSMRTDTLHVNYQNGFTGGVVFGDTHASIALSSGTATFRVGVGIPGLVRVNGAVRAAAGTTADNAGFSFEGNTQTGMFLESSNLRLYTNNVLRMTLPPDLVDGVRIIGDLRYGNPHKAAFSDNAGVMQINPSQEFSSISFSQGSMLLAHSSGQGQLDVTGSVRVATGVAGVRGFAFVTDTTTGMFRQESAGNPLVLQVDGTARVSLSKSASEMTLAGNLVLSGASREITMDTTSLVKNTGSGILVINDNGNELTFGSRVIGQQGANSGYRFSNGACMEFDANSLHLRSGVTTAIALSTSSNQITMTTASLVISGDTLTMGAGAVLQSTPNLLTINPEEVRTLGVYIPSRVRIGSNGNPPEPSGPNQLTQTLDVAGGISVFSGLPSASPSEVGFQFQDPLLTGYFFDTATSSMQWLFGLNNAGATLHNLGDFTIKRSLLLDVANPKVALSYSGDTTLRMNANRQFEEISFSQSTAILRGVPSTSFVEFRVEGAVTVGLITGLPSSSANYANLFVGGPGANSTGNGLHVYINGGDSVVSTVPVSDARLKENVTTLSDGLQLVQKLRGVEYQWREEAKNAGQEAGRREYGFLAQEVQEVAPVLVKELSLVHGDFLTVDYERVSAVLVEAVKDQQKQIERVVEENRQLRQEMEELKRLLMANLRHRDP